MLTVHHLNNSRSQRVLWLLEELSLPYEIKFYQRDPETMLAPPSLKAVHPLGKSPVLSDGAAVVAESGAILEYVLDRYGEGRLRPEPNTDAYLRYRYFMHYPESSLMPLMLLALVFDRVGSAKVPFFLKPVISGLSNQVRKEFIEPQVGLHLAFLEQELTGKQWLLGDELSAADVQLSFPIEGAAVRAGLAPYPELRRYLSQIRARPAYQRALEKGGPFSLG